MKKKTGVILSSAAAIAVCASVMAGSTYALFTSESKTDISVSSGSVKVVATVNEDSLKTKQLYDAEWTEGTEGLFGGSVVFGEYSLNVENFAAGDAVSFTIDVSNVGTINAKYRTVIKSETGLGELDVTIGGESVAYDGTAAYGEWADIAVGETVNGLEVVIELPETAVEQNAVYNLTYIVEAVQGNAAVSGESASVNGVRYASFEEALTAAGNGDTVMLIKDTVLTDVAETVIDKSITVDLNGKALTTAKNATYSVENGGELTFKNGNLNMSNSTVINSAISIEKGCSLTLDGVNFTAENQYGIFPYGDAASVNVLNSNIVAAVAIGTNAGSDDNYHVNINVENTTISAVTGMLINVPCTVNVSNCTISGEWQGVIARCGDITITDSVIKNISTGDVTLSNGAVVTPEFFDKISWQDGNGVPFAGLTIGNKSAASGYQHPVVVNLVNTQIVSDYYCTVYIYGNTTENNGATLTYTSDCELDEIVNGGGQVTVIKK